MVRGYLGGEELPLCLISFIVWLDWAALGRAVLVCSSGCLFLWDLVGGREGFMGSNCYCWMCHGLELLGQRFRGQIYCAVFCELALCQSNAPEAVSIVLCSVVPGLCLDHPSECSIVLLSI